MTFLNRNVTTLIDRRLLLPILKLRSCFLILWEFRRFKLFESDPNLVRSWVTKPPSCVFCHRSSLSLLHVFLICIVFPAFTLLRKLFFYRDGEVSFLSTYGEAALLSFPFPMKLLCIIDAGKLEKLTFWDFLYLSRTLKVSRTYPEFKWFKKGSY